jgi:hypothetical protein
MYKKNMKPAVNHSKIGRKKNLKELKNRNPFLYDEIVLNIRRAY